MLWLDRDIHVYKHDKCTEHWVVWFVLQNEISLKLSKQCIIIQHVYEINNRCVEPALSGVA